jgi:hypothetical protein
MQYFDGELEKLLRAGTIDLETCMSFATNPGNLALQITDLQEDTAETQVVELPPGAAAEVEFEVERTSAR